LLPIRFVAKLSQHFLRGRRAQVRADKGGFKIVKRVTVNFLAKGNDFFNALGEVLRVRVTASFMRSKSPVLNSSVLPNRVWIMKSPDLIIAARRRSRTEDDT
jgi:hypothetical protein